MARNYLTSLICSLCTLTLTACSIPEEWDKDKQDESQSGPPSLSNFDLEQRDDNLFYQTGSDTPFTGTHFALDLHKELEEDRPGFVMETPYENGQIHGIKKTYYPGGALQEERVYDAGIPQNFTIYYSDGEVKIKSNLNADNLSHGDNYVRYYRDGTLQNKGGHKDGRWHGEKIDYDEDGTLKSHYIFNEGRIMEIIHETEDARKSRLQHYGEVSDEVIAPDPPPSTINEE